MVSARHAGMSKQLQVLRQLQGTICRLQDANETLQGANEKLQLTNDKLLGRLELVEVGCPCTAKA